MGETETPHFYDFRIFGHVPEPQNHYLFIFGDTRTLQTIQDESQIIFQTYIYICLESLGLDFFETVGPVYPTHFEHFEFKSLKPRNLFF